ncbi:MAG: thiamine phosphate synthase [Pseudomonadota bacterium]
MSKAPKTETERPAPRLYLVTPEVEDAAAFARTLTDALGAADIAAVLLRLKKADERTQINRIKTLASVVQPAGVALVLDGMPELAARGGADGAHLNGFESFSAAVSSLKPERIAGCGGLDSRDDAMTAAEEGADYVLFGEPDGNGDRPSLESILERIEWWAELFQVPCVAFAANADEVGPLAAAGADFVAIHYLWDDPRGVKPALTDAASKLTAEAVA